MQSSKMEGFSRVDIELTPYIEDPKIEEKISQSLTRLLVWDYAEKTWRPLAANASGQISTTTQAPATSSASYSSHNITTSASVIAGENLARQRIILTNNRAGVVYVGFDSSVSITTGFPLSSGQTLDIKETTSTIYGIAVSGLQEVRVLEF